MINVLSVTSECAPLIKTGGLADVAGALPLALRDYDIHMRTLLPGYPAVMERIDRASVAMKIDDLFGGPAKLLTARCQDLDLIIVDAPHLYDRPGNIYLGPDGTDWPDNPQRFAALCQVAVEISKNGIKGWKPEICHGHDWQAGLIPEYLRTMPNRPATVMTIHNIAFQGLAPAEMIESLMLDKTRFTKNGFEFWGKISTLKAGLIEADRITTVSQNYAEELKQPQFGMGLEGVIQSRQDVLSGIVNGIDDKVWNPATDAAIVPYTTPAGKSKNKAILQNLFGLPKSSGPLCVVVSRLTDQKGLDLLLQALPALLDRGGQLALLGTGDRALEAAFTKAASHRNVGVKIGYDETLSHKMIAGADAILIPSRFEPCGLTQLYGLRYGTVPVVAHSGGLADTVINASPAALSVGCATGVQFLPITADGLANALLRLCDLYSDKPTWSKLRRNGMKQPVGWQQSAAAYADIYKALLSDI